MSTPDNDGAGRGEAEKIRAQQLNDAQSIVKELAGLKLTNLIPPDVDAIEHAREHANDDGRTEVAVNADMEMREALRKWEAGKTQLADLRARLRRLLDELKIDIEV